MKKIAILTNIIPPYRLPLFNGIAKTHEVDVLICKQTEKNREWKIEDKNLFNVIQLRGIELSLKNSLGDYRFIYLKFTVLFYLLFKKPEYLIIGDASFTSYFSAFICKLLNIKYIWWNEVLPFTPISKGFVDKLRSYSIQNAYHHFVSGTLAKEFIESYGVNEETITIVPDAVDNELYFDYYQEFSSSREEFRKNYHIKKDEFVFLYVGQFIQRKNIMLILNTFKKALNEDNNLKLFLVGGGEQQAEIEKFVKDNSLAESVTIKEFLDTKELSKVYTLSDALIIVSESEPWGMVVNEAMCFGLPVLASYTVGASADLIDNNTGFVIQNFNDTQELAHTILDFKSKKWNRENIQEKVFGWNNELAIVNTNEIVNDI